MIRKVLSLLVFSIACCAVADASAQDFSAELSKARAEACAVGGGSMLISAIQHAEGDDLNALILETSADWMLEFNAFSGTDSARLLRAFAEGAHQSGAATYSGELCSVLMPVLSVAFSGPLVSEAGGAVDGGYLLDQGVGGLEIPASISAVGDLCDYAPLMIPVQDPCTK